MNRRLARPNGFNPFAVPGLLFTQPIGEPSGGGGAPTGDPKEDPKGEPAKTVEKTLTQSEVNVIAAREKAEGKRAAETALADSLGVSIEDAKAIITEHKAAIEAKKTEIDKAQDKANQEKTAATAEKTAAAKEIHETRLERAFLKEGLDPDATDEKTKRVLRMVTVEPGASYDEVLKDVQAVKADFPMLFEVADPKATKTTKRQAPGGDPKGNPPKPAGSEDAFARGAERAKGHRQAFTAVVENTKK